LAIIFYLKSAWTNPGYLIGSAEDVAKKAGAYDPKDWIIQMSNVDNVSATGQYYGDGGHERNLSNIDNNNLEEISQAGFDKHNRNPSFLTKDFSISRHER